MTWTSQTLNVFGPSRAPIRGTTVATAAVPAPLWRAEVKILERHTPASPAWRHLFIENSSWTPAAHSQLRAHLPGLSIIRCTVNKLVVALFDLSPPIEFGQRAGGSHVVTLLVQTLPRDDINPEQWDINHPAANAHDIHNTPILLCVGGEILTSELSTTGDWRQNFLTWSSDNAAIGATSLVAHSSGLALEARAPLMWSDRALTARYNVLIPRPAESRFDNTLLIEIDRQWLFSDRSNAQPALADLRKKFRELNTLFRSSSVAKSTHWVHLALQNPDGPPQFDWLVRRNEPSLFRLRPGEANVSLADQILGSKEVVPRSIATIEGELNFIAGTSNSFRVRISAVRELSIENVDLSGAQRDKLNSWVGRLLYEDRRLRWLPGCSMSHRDATQLRLDFNDQPAIRELISNATLHVHVPTGVTFNFSAYPQLDERTEVREGRLRWFGVAVHAESDDLVATDQALRQLETVIGLSTGRRVDVLLELRRRILAQIDYSYSPTTEQIGWSAIDTTYDSNEVAEFLRGVQNVRRPDPDEIPSNGLPGEYLVEPAMLWGTMPLENGWAMLPFFNTTDELYLRILQPEQAQAETALISGVAVWGNDDFRMWSLQLNEQRWNMTLLDSDQILGCWSFERSGGTNPAWALSAARLRFYQPEVVFNGLFWLSTVPPTVRDSLPDLDHWPSALRSIALRSPRTHELYPSPYVVVLPQGGMLRKDLGAQPRQQLTLNSFAALDEWRLEFETNPRLVHVPIVQPARVELSRFDPTVPAPLVPDETERLHLIRRLRWPSTIPVTQQAIDRLRLWQSNVSLQRDFRRAAGRLAFLMEKAGIGASAENLIESFHFTDGALIAESAADWGPLFQRLVMESVLIWDGGTLDDASRALLIRRRDDPQLAIPLRSSAGRMLVALETIPDDRRRIFDLIVSHPFWSYRFVAADFFKPLVWRRHPTLPFIQSLPLTQSQSPPSHPSSSRQLAPFELSYAPTPPATVEDPDPATPPVPLKWIFKSAEAASATGGTAACYWAEYGGPDSLLPARDWTTAGPDGPRLLPMVSLTLPGVSAHPTPHGAGAPINDPTATYLPLQWSYGLPYLNEQYAIAQLPREDGLSEQPNAPSLQLNSDQRGPSQPAPLKRETFKQGWDELGNRALLAAADQESGLTYISDNEHHMVSLVEPFVWRVKAAVTNKSFPGQLTLDDLHTPSARLHLVEPLADGYSCTPPLAGPQHSALRGIQGTFAKSNTTQITLAPFATLGDQFDIVAGSMHGKLEADGRLRDQRGLLRSPTSASPKWLKTVVGNITLYSSLQAIDLDLRGWGTWQLWFRDLPISGNSFQRGRSTTNEDINDPAAEGSAQNSQQGYEWRLVDAQGAPALQAGQLPFLPLTLQKVIFASDNVTEVELTGRLQLPLPAPKNEPGAILERDQEANVVRLKFSIDGNGLKWSVGPLAEASGGLSVPLPGTPPTTQIIWPLSALAGAPQISCGNIEFFRDGSVYKLRLIGPRVDLGLLGVGWSPSVTTDAVIDSAASPSAWDLEHGNNTASVWIERTTVKLDLTSTDHKHELSVALQARWGASNRPHIKVEKVLQLLPEPQVSVKGWFVCDASTLLDLRGDQGSALVSDVPKDVRQALFTPAIQVTWRELEAPWAGPQDGPYAFYVLPGCGVRHDVVRGQSVASLAPGYATFSFQVKPGVTPQDLPQFVGSAGASELLLQCNWGDALQEHDQGDDDWGRTLRAFGSSAGSVSIALLTSVNSSSAVRTTLLLNGMFEVKNLVSWPKPIATECDPDDSAFTRQRVGADYHHWRHTARILLNQITIDESNLQSIPSGQDIGPPTLYALSGAFQFLSVVQHQIAELTLGMPAGPGLAPQVTRVAREFRWNVAQEVRLCRPATLAEFWGRFLPSTGLQPSTVDTARNNLGGFLPVPKAVTGWLREGLLQQLLVVESDVRGLRAMRDATIVVELSAAIYLPRTSRRTRVFAGDDDFVNVQVLPGEIDQAIAADFLDFVPPSNVNGSDDAPWSIAVLPFVGRLQAAHRDGIKGPSDPIQFNQRSNLCVDPVLWLTRPSAQRPQYMLDLTSRREIQDVVHLADFDRLQEQRWRSVDPVSLEAGWYRLLTPPREVDRDHTSVGADQPLASILSVLPQGGIGRISRAASLDQLFDPDLLAYPSTAQVSEPAAPFSAIDWRFGGLLVLHAFTLGTTSDDYSFIAAGKRLSQILGTQALGNNGLTRLAALTLIPPKMRSEKVSDPLFETKLSQSVSVVPSPYLAIRRQPLQPPTFGASEAVAVFADLVVLSARGASGTSAIVAATKLWQKRYREASGNPELVPLPEDSEIEAWAEDTRRGLASDSLIAVVRIRRVFQNQLTRLPSLGYVFLVLGPAYPVPLPPPTQRQLRPELGLLRAREGQFGGTILPPDLSPLSLAPPQVTSVEPLHLEAPPTQKPQAGTPTEVLDWEWGYSGLRLSSVLTRDEIGQVSPPFRPLDTGLALQAPTRVFWTAISHPVQFTEDLPRRVTFLPANFRSASIRGLLPAPPGIPCPSADSFSEAFRSSGDDAPVDEPWQGELPGAHQTLMVGGRPGAYMVMRSHLQTQLATPYDVYQFGGTWATGDKVLIQRSGVELTVIAQNPEIERLVDQVVHSIKSSVGSAFVDLIARREGTELHLRLVPDGHDHDFEMVTLESNGSVPTTRNIGREGRRVAGMQTLITTWEFTGVWSSGNLVIVRYHSLELLIPVPSSNLQEILAHVGRTIDSSSMATFGALRSATNGTNRLEIWFDLPDVKFRSLNANGSAGDPQRIVHGSSGTVMSVTTSGSVPVQHRWPRPTHIPANRLASRGRQGEEMLFVGISGTWEANDKIKLDSGANTATFAAGSTDIVQIANAVVSAINGWPILTARRNGNVVVVTRRLPTDTLNLQVATTESDDTAADEQVIEILERVLPRASRAQLTALAPWGSWFDLQQERSHIVGTGAPPNSIVEARFTCGAYRFTRIVTANQDGDWACLIDSESLPTGHFVVSIQATSGPLTRYSPKTFDNGCTTIIGHSAPANGSLTVTFSNGSLSHQQFVTADASGAWKTEFDWSVLPTGLIRVTAKDATNNALPDPAPARFHRGLNEVSGYGAPPNLPVSVSFSVGTYSLQRVVTADAQGDWSLNIDWSTLPIGLIKVTAADSTSRSVPVTPQELRHFLNRSVDARLDPHDSLFVANGDRVYELDVALLPVVLNESALLSDRWPNSYEVTLRLTASPPGTQQVWKDLNAQSLRFQLCSATECVQFELDDSVPLPLRRFRPKDNAAQDALSRMMSATVHGDTLWFELNVQTEKFSGTIEGPPLTARLPVFRIRSSELPAPLTTMFCNFEDPEYSRRLSSPTSRATKNIRQVLPATSQSTYSITLALDRQEYNASSTFFLLVDAPAGIPTGDIHLEINRIRPDGIKTLVGPAIDDFPIRQLVDLRFGAKDSWSHHSLQFKAPLAAGDKVEFTLKPKSPLDDRVTIVLSVQIVGDLVTPPPEAGYALLRRLTEVPTAAVECVRFAWSPPANRIELIDPADLLRDSVRRRAVFQWYDTVRSTTSAFFGLQKLSPNGSTLIPVLCPPVPTESIP